MGGGTDAVKEKPSRFLAHGERFSGWASFFPSMHPSKNPNQDQITNAPCNDIGATPAHATEFFNRTYAIEYMASVNEERHQGEGWQRRAIGHHWHHDDLHGAGKDKQSRGGEEKDAIINRLLEHLEDYGWITKMAREKNLDSPIVAGITIGPSSKRIQQ